MTTKKNYSKFVIKSKLENIDIFDSPNLQCFKVKTNLSLNLTNLMAFLPIVSFSMAEEDQDNVYVSDWDKEIAIVPESNRSGTIVALKYKTTIRGKNDLFKSKNGFKNACHILMCHALNRRRKKLVHIKISASGNLQIMGIPTVDVEKVVFKLFLILEKINKKHDIFRYVSTTKTAQHNRLEILIVPILNNYMFTLKPEIIEKIFKNSKVQIVQKFIDNDFLSFMMPSDPAITIKKSFVYEDYQDHLIKYITWNKKHGKITRYIEYNNYTTLLKDAQKDNSMSKKYTNLRLYSSGKVLVSGFDKILVQKAVESFLSVCDRF